MTTSSYDRPVEPPLPDYRQKTPPAGDCAHVWARIVRAMYGTTPYYICEKCKVERPSITIIADLQRRVTELEEENAELHGFDSVEEYRAACLSHPVTANSRST